MLADDHGIFRDGLKLLLALHPEFEVVAEAERHEPLKQLVQTHQPDALILDYQMPGGEGSATVGYLKQRHPGLKVLVLTGTHTAAVLHQLVQAGADAVLLKDGGGAQLLAQLRAVLAGQRVIPPEVAALAGQADHGLTRREFQITQLICDGLSAQAIAELLSLSPKTVDKHRENILRKLEVSSVAQLMRKVQAAGWRAG